jgi:hypothetical protein
MLVSEELARINIDEHPTVCEGNVQSRSEMEMYAGRESSN